MQESHTPHAKHLEFERAVTEVCKIIEAELAKLGNAELSLKIFLAVYSRVCGEVFQLIKSTEYDGMPILLIRPPENARLSLRICEAIIPAFNEPATRHNSQDRKTSRIQIYQATIYRLMLNWTTQERLIGEKNNLRIRISDGRSNQSFPQIKPTAE